MKEISNVARHFKTFENFLFSLPQSKFSIEIFLISLEDAKANFFLPPYPPPLIPAPPPYPPSYTEALDSHPRLIGALVYIFTRNMNITLFILSVYLVSCDLL